MQTRHNEIKKRKRVETKLRIEKELRKISGDKNGLLLVYFLQSSKTNEKSEKTQYTQTKTREIKSV